MTVTEANHKGLASPGASSLEAQPRTSARHAQRPPRQRLSSNAQTAQLVSSLLFSGISTTVVDRRETELIPAFDSGMSWPGIDVVFATRTNAAGAQCRATRAIAMR